MPRLIYRSLRRLANPNAYTNRLGIRAYRSLVANQGRRSVSRRHGTFPDPEARRSQVVTIRVARSARAEIFVKHLHLRVEPSCRTLVQNPREEPS